MRISLRETPQATIVLACRPEAADALLHSPIGDTTREAMLLRPDTLAMMTSNQLTQEQRSTTRLLGRLVFAAGHGYGMGVAVVMEPEKAERLRCRGGTGTIGWPGAYGGWWQADPKDRSVLIFLAHNMLQPQQMAHGIGLGAWSAIASFHELATARL